MKRFFCLLLVALCLICFGGCKEKSDDLKYLYEGDWYFHDDIIGEDLNITFSEENEYFYACDCGEPVGDSDLYDSYSFNKEQCKITLSGCEDDKSELKLLYCDEYYLCLDFDDSGIKTFKNHKKQPETFVVDSLKDTVKGDMFLSFLGYEDGVITVAPNHYDGDSKEMFADRIYELKASKNMKLVSVAVTVDKGKETVEKLDLTENDYKHIGEYYNSGFVTLNESGEIAEIIVYGLTEIQ